MDDIEPLVTPRLVLRAVREEDAAALRDYYVRNEVRMVPWEPPRSHAIGDHAAAIRRQADPCSGERVVELLGHETPGGALVAVVTLRSFTAADPPGAEISYSVDGAYEGRGLASEAVGCVAAYAFGPLGLQVLSAYYHPDNTRSEALLRRLGFTEVVRTPVIPGLGALLRPHVLAQLRAESLRARGCVS